MKKLIIAFFLLAKFNYVFAQTNLKDIDYMVGKNGALLELKPQRLNPTSKICFDKRFWFSTNLSGRIVKGCFYVNTHDGYVGMNNNYRDSDCNISLTDKNLSFTILSKMGQNFTYSNGSRGEQVYMSLSVRMPNMSGKFIKRHGRNEGERRRFTELSLPTWAYYDPAEGETPAAMYKYMYGNGYPLDGNIKGYLGAHGVGFFIIGEETFICLSQEKGDKFTTVDRIENVNFCFDGSGFKDIKAATARENEVVLKDDRKSAEMSEESIKNSNGYCKESELRLLEHEKLMLANRERANKLMGERPNMNDKANQKIMADSQDPINEVIRLRLVAIKEQCDARYTMDKIATQESQKARVKQKIQCLEQRIEALTELEDKLIKINDENPDNPAKAQLQKNMYYLSKISKIPQNNTCN